VGASSSQIRLLLVEDVSQVAQYIRNLLNAQDQVKPLVLVEPEARISKEMTQIAVTLLQAQTVALAATR
jgi:hypothetical protein